MKALLITTAGWAVAIVFLCIASLRPTEIFDFPVLICLFIMLAFQLALLIVSAIAVTRAKHKRIPALCFLLPLGATLYFFTFGQNQLEAWKYKIEQTQRMERVSLYDTLLKREKLSRGALALSGYQYEVDTGPPERIAFIEPGGLLDNYTAIVHDPTDLVMKSNQFQDYSKWDDPKLQSVKKLFGGDMMWAEHLRGHWYLCGFT